MEKLNRTGENTKAERAAAETADAPDQSGTGDSQDMASPKSTQFAAFQFYPRDFLTSDKVARMSMTEIGIYITLLSYAWLGRGLPPDQAEIAKMLRLPLPRFKKMWAGVLSECFVLKGGKFINPRQEQQRKELHDYVASCQRGGERSAEVRRSRFGSAQPPKPPRSDLRSATEVTPNTSSSSSSSSSEERTRTAPAPLIAKRRLDAAWEGPKGLYVPQRKHSDFIGLRDHPGAEAELFSWYDAVAAAWVGSPGSDMMKFWTARFDEKWPATATTASKGRAWAV